MLHPPGWSSHFSSSIITIFSKSYARRQVSETNDKRKRSPTPVRINKGQHNILILCLYPWKYCSFAFLHLPWAFLMSSLPVSQSYLYTTIHNHPNIFNFSVWTNEWPSWLPTSPSTTLGFLVIPLYAFLSIVSPLFVRRHQNSFNLCLILNERCSRPGSPSVHVLPTIYLSLPIHLSALLALSELFITIFTTIWSHFVPQPMNDSCFLSLNYIFKTSLSILLYILLNLYSHSFSKSSQYLQPSPLGACFLASCLAIIRSGSVFLSLSVTIPLCAFLSLFSKPFVRRQVSAQRVRHGGRCTLTPSPSSSTPSSPVYILPVLIHAGLIRL